MLRATVLFTVLGLALPLYLALEIPWFRWDASASILYGCVLYCALRLAQLGHSGERRFISLTFWLFVYVWGVLSGFLQVGADMFPWKRQHGDGEQLHAAVVMVIALLAYDLGGWIAGRQERARAVPTAVSFSLQRALLIGCIAIATTAAAIAMVGGPAVLLQPRGDVSSALWQESGAEVASRNLLEAVLRGAPYVATVTLLFVVQRRWKEMRPRDRLLMLGAFLAILPLAMITNFPNALSRGWLGTVALSVIFMLTPWRRWSMAALTLLFMALFVFAFPYSDRNRIKTEEARANTIHRVYHSPAGPLLVKGDYDVFVQTVNASIYTRDLGYEYGRNLFGALLFWVPRRLWQDKPINSGHEIGLHMRNSVINLSAPLWVEGYLTLGGAGVALVMALYGFLTRAAEARYLTQLRLGVHWGVLQLFVPFWAGYQVFFLRGPLLNSFAYCSFSVLLFVLLAEWKLRRLSPVPRPGLAAR